MTNGTVILGFGPQPMDWFSKATKAAGRDAVLDQDVARMAGATLAAGTREALDALRQRLAAGALQAQQQAKPGLSHAATLWLAHGERCISSETMFTRLTGVDALGSHGAGHPYDPADFRRCRLLLEAVPELQPLLPNMANESPAWAGLVEAWADICNTMDDETPNWRSPRGERAPLTYQLIKTAIGR